MKIREFLDFLFYRINEKTPESLDFTGLSGVLSVPMRENYYFLLKPCTTIDWAFIDILCQTCWYNDRAVG